MVASEHGMMGAMTEVVTPPIGLRERKKAQTYDAIVSAALDLFERDGYDATTVEDIAEAADVSPRTFFRYFDAKVDVIMMHKGDRGGELDQLIAARPDDEGPVEAVRHVMRDVLGPMLTEDPVTNRQLRIMLTTPSLRALARDHFNEHEDEMARVFANRLGVDENTLRPHVIAAAVGITMWTVINRWVADDRAVDELVPMIDEGFALLAAGLE
jgi:AcrR family transcriptional regulator